MPVFLTIFVTFLRARISNLIYLYVIIKKIETIPNGIDFALYSDRNSILFGGGIVNQKRFLGICLIFLLFIFIFIQPAYMGPGGIITKALLKSFWCKAALALMALTCLSLSIYVYVREEIIAE